MIVALNNKCNLGKEEFKEYMDRLNLLDTTDEMILCPSFINIPYYNSSKIKLGAQNVSNTPNGAYTGEISCEQLKSYGVEYCIIGHSERRGYQKETNEDISLKIQRLIENGIKPILCIGESKEEYETGQTLSILTTEINAALENVSSDIKKDILIAYEPIWSIGTGIIPTNEEIERILTEINRMVPECKLLYGGSANESNIDTLKKCPHINGYLLGGLSLKTDKLQIFLDKLKW